LTTAEGITDEMIAEYLRSGRNEPNLHIFTNPLYPPHATPLEAALQVESFCMHLTFAMTWPNHHQWLELSFLHIPFWKLFSFFTETTLETELLRESITVSMYE